LLVEIFLWPFLVALEHREQQFKQRIKAAFPKGSEIGQGRQLVLGSCIKRVTSGAI
jgi:hypothetical protein